MRAPTLFAALAGAAAAQNSALKDILAKAGTGNYTYATAFTQGILPKPLHSHNDYWRPVPFYSALAAGAISIETDVYLINSTLYVGHERTDLSQRRTLDSLYIQPILSVLETMNPDDEFVEYDTKNGVFDMNVSQTLYLWIDVKTDGPTAWPYVVRALEPLRRAGYLTRYDGTSVSQSAVTVIGTGNTPRNLVEPVKVRDYFWDAPVDKLDSTASNITREVSPIASGSFASNFGGLRNTTMGAQQLSKLRGQLKVAHDKGMLVRYWDLPGWPVGTRNSVWRTLWDEGADLINVDELEAAAGLWERE
ncbi:hypothetical protein GE09DRAFT_1230163 [Coniochaeta sp. 2T2.1]|nr:hypothetical protein GE09DRAFT_1230163 [Coniochaeta sp. 2T2.1]